MARSAMLAPGGGIGAGTPFTVGTFLQVTSVSPPLAATGNIVQLAGFVGIPGPAQGDATNLNRAIGIGLDLQSYTANIVGTTRNPVIIGYQAGYFVASVPGDGIAIGAQARTDGNSVVIGVGCTIKALSGTSVNVIIASGSVTNGANVGTIAIGCGGASIASSRGTYLGAKNTVNVGDGCGIGTDGAGPDIRGAGGIAIGTATTAVTGGLGIAIGANAIAAANGIALGQDALAPANTMNLGAASAPVRFVVAAGPVCDPLVTLVYSAAMTPLANAGNHHTVTATNGVAFTFNAPTGTPAAGIRQRLVLRVRNTSGGVLGAVTFNAVFKLGAAWVSPANGFSRTIEFDWDGTNWVEANRSAADVAN